MTHTLSHQSVGDVVAAVTDALDGRLDGRVITPSDSDYDTARALFNGMIDRRPAVIIRCRTEQDIVAAVACVHGIDVDIAVRCGGHSVAGHSVCDDGVVIDLTEMRSVSVDPARRTATAQGGALWQDFDLVAGRAGLATPGGVISTTGVAGFTVGGGVGWLSRRFGMTCDNVVGARVVTPDHGVLTASADENPELFWAIRGGGGNFGVVSEITLQLHDVSTVIGGVAAFDLTDGVAVVRHYRDVMDSAPDQLGAILDFAPAVDDETRTQVSLISCDSDVSDEGGQSTRELQSVPDVTPVGKLVHREFPYAMWQTMLDHTAPHGRLNYWKTVFLDEVSDAVVDTLVDIAATLPSAVSRMHLIRMGGFASRCEPGATAFTARHHPYVVHLITSWEDPEATAGCVRWTREAYDRLEPFAAEGAYLNFIGDEGQDRIRASFGEETYQRLRAVKRQFDPHNRFHLNQNIEPD
ncbi:FAD-binding oxidoreductase [Williamsia sterculiae]|uniref:FAD/FMN-containing dehydrogenase n=1 Tax=Williamsia sterculiae TaxID=1344003 RepID=A0A1N7DP47_9NOCA|nr:FAD-binding oxidoreductase [Williamsia sterculiae]SIR77636.1 FAD/FMN-containing dehydrogenase [Williamsia sterculiae]